VTERVVVTGAAGFIGSHACHVLLQAGWQVVGLDNCDPFYPRWLKEAALTPHADATGIRVDAASGAGVGDRRLRPLVRGGAWT
jgi:nucleoside-diphosphate-sugar epimerase